MKLKIKIIPNSSQNKIFPPDEEGVIKIKLTTPPVEGKANQTLIKLLLKHYNASKSQIKIVSGLTSKNKVVEIN